MEAEEAALEDLPADDFASPTPETPRRASLKRSEQAPVPAVPPATAPSETLDKLPDAGDDLLPSDTLSKRYASGNVTVEQVTDMETADKQMERGWDEKEEVATRSLANFFIVLVPILLLIGGAVFYAIKNAADITKPDARGTDGVSEQLRGQSLSNKEETLDRQERKEVEAIYSQLVGRTEAFLRATTVEEKARFIRQPERVLPLMEKYYEKNELKPLELERAPSFSPATLDLSAFWIAQASIVGEEDVAVLIEQTEDNELLIDWETFVSYQEHSWDEMIEKRPEGRYEFRLRATFADFYVYEFSDKSEWVCVHLTSRHGLKDGYGFFKKDAPFAEELIAQLNTSQRTKSPLALIVEASFPQDTKVKKSLIIHDVLSFRWVYVDEPGPTSE